MTNNQAPPTNGAAAATLLSLGLGGLVLGVLALAGDAMPAVAKALNIWNPTGPLSGVTLAAIVVWLAAWTVLARRWSARTLDLRLISGVSAGLILAGLLLTFPPFMDLLQGK
jgi:hypothetical protein